MCSTGLSTKEAFNFVQMCKDDIAPNEGFLRQLVVFGREASMRLHRNLIDKYGYETSNKDLRTIWKQHCRPENLKNSPQYPHLMNSLYVEENWREDIYKSLIQNLERKM